MSISFPQKFNDIITARGEKSKFCNRPSMKLFVVTTALTMGLALGLPVADEKAIKITRPGELSSRLTARYVIVLLQKIDS